MINYLRNLGSGMWVLKHSYTYIVNIFLNPRLTPPPPTPSACMRKTISPTIYIAITLKLDNVQIADLGITENT